MERSGKAAALRPQYVESIPLPQETPQPGLYNSAGASSLRLHLLSAAGEIRKKPKQAKNQLQAVLHHLHSPLRHLFLSKCNGF
jgi:hypothetical protein